MNEEKEKPSKFSADYAFGYRGTSKISHKLLWISAAFIIIAVVWAYFASLDEVTVANGKVIPSKQIQVIQNLEGGIIKEILVHQGQTVKQGETIVLLDNKRFASEYESAKHKQLGLQIKVLRLTAQVNGKPFVVPDDIQKANPELVASEMSLYNSQNDQVRSLEQRRDLVAKEKSMTEPLIKEGAVSKVDVIRLQESIEEIQNQISTTKSEMLDQLNTSKSELASLNSELEGIHDRYQRTTIVSPVRGIINEIYVTTVGGVIKPGENIMDIVPLDDTLLIEARVRPSDIGFIHVGQDATVKITAYDYSIYGGFKGKVEYISSDTLKDEKKDEYYYEMRVRTSQNYLKGKDGKLLYIIPGMTASVDILTGQKSVLDYILKPIIKAKQSALRER
jgi:adhesin transport system membrane fusion protein